MIERSDLLGSTLVRCAPRRNRHRALWCPVRESIGAMGLALIGVAVGVLLFVW